jgi:haloalkane dehalogenase
VPPTLERLDGTAYRQLLPEHGAERAPAAVFLHGYPESSYLWREVMPGAADVGWRALAPDLAGFGDSEPRPPGTWEHQIEHLDRFVSELDLGAIALVVHDWGGLIGLRWACDNPGAVRALVISNTGFFEDGRWHGFAKVLQTPGEGERAVAAMDRDLLALALRQECPEIDDASIDEFAKCLEGDERRQGHLDLYRSGDFTKLEAYRGRLADLGVPTLLLWGAQDRFAPVGGAHRFKRELPHAELVIVDDAGHFLPEQRPERFRDELRRFLGGLSLAG